MRHALSYLPFFCLVAMLALLAGCKEEMVSAGVNGYDHIPLGQGGVSGFAVNGYSFEVPGYQCCVSIPREWRPGLKVKIDWLIYEPRPGVPSERDPNSYSETVEIPQYRPDEATGFHVHFYPGHKIKIVMSRYEIRHPFYPMTKEEQLPFKVDPVAIYRFQQTPALMSEGATNEDWEWAKQWGLDKAELFANAKEQ
jgi:hypothetical protein